MSAAAGAGRIGGRLRTVLPGTSCRCPRRWGRPAWYGSLWRRCDPSEPVRSSSTLTSRATSCSTRGYRRWSSTCPPYWRPPCFAAAVVVADALVWEAAGDQLLESLQWNADDAQFLLRALLFRAITDLLHRPHEEPSSVTRPYQPVLEFALRLAEN